MKKFKEQKKIADKLLKLNHHQYDDEGRAVINMNVRDDCNFLSEFSSTEKPVISDNVADFIEKSAITVLPKEQISLHVYADCIDDNEKVVYSTAIKEYYSAKYVENERELRRNNIWSLLLLLAGIFTLAIMLLLDYLGKGSIIIEVVDIIGWVFLWESADIFFLSNRQIKLKRWRYLNLMHLNVKYFPENDGSGNLRKADKEEL